MLRSCFFRQTFCTSCGEYCGRADCYIGGDTKCCGNKIMASGKSCDNNEPPCILGGVSAGKRSLASKDCSKQIVVLLVMTSIALMSEVAILCSSLCVMALAEY
jgi:hypothetical protein